MSPGRTNGSPRTTPTGQPVLVIGGAGFIGCNLAHRLLEQGHTVRILDDLSRPGVEQNLRWLEERASSARPEGGAARPEAADAPPDVISARIGDVRDRGVVREAVRGVCAVFHLAGQVAVTTSLRDPVHDFEVNLQGTLNVLEALRSQQQGEAPPLVFASTNKVYGDMEDMEIEERAQRYQPADVMLRTRGISEQWGLSFRSPYGCSKGAADQYVLDYAHSFGLPTSVLRMSCIYGPRQQGTEEQGWVAHFLRSAIRRTGVTIYGDGKQVRDVLFVDDAVEAFLRAWRDIDALSGRAFNIGGSPKYGISLLELLAMIEELRGAPLDVRFAPWRPGDQRFYVSDIQAFRDATGWLPRTDVHTGLTALHSWLLAQEGAPADAATGVPPAPGVTAQAPPQEPARETPPTAGGH